jgi:hypothetical protein
LKGIQRATTVGRRPGPRSARRPATVDSLRRRVPLLKEYRYYKRPERIKDAVGRASLRSDIGKPMITLHGTLDTLLPIRRYANLYREMV